MKKLTFKKIAEKILEENKEPMSAIEIWNKAKNNGLADQLQSKGKTPELTIMARLYVDIRDNEDSVFCQPNKRPAKFQLKKYMKKENIDIGTQIEPNKKIKKETQQVIYAFEVAKATYGTVSLNEVKIGHTKNIESTEMGYRRSHSHLKKLGVWKCNDKLLPTECEKGIDKLADKYKVNSDREIFIFLDDDCSEFLNHVSLLLEKID